MPVKKPLQLIGWSKVMRSTRTPGRTTAPLAGKVLRTLGRGEKLSGLGSRQVACAVTVSSSVSLTAAAGSDGAAAGAGLGCAWAAAPSGRIARATSRTSYMPAREHRDSAWPAIAIDCGPRREVSAGGSPYSRYQFLA